MRRWALLAVCLAGLGGMAHGADFKTLRSLSATPPTQVEPLPAGRGAPGPCRIRARRHPAPATARPGLWPMRNSVLLHQAGQATEEA